MDCGYTTFVNFVCICTHSDAPVYLFICAPINMLTCMQMFVLHMKVGQNMNAFKVCQCINITTARIDLTSCV